MDSAPSSSSMPVGNLLLELPESHFLSLPRPSIFGDDTSLPSGVADTTTLAAHDFDVDTRTGFMPPEPPIRRLPEEWEAWEGALESAIKDRLILGEEVAKLDGVDRDREYEKSEKWRSRVRSLPILSTANLTTSEVLLRRAHLVLAWVMHFYVHSLPPGEPVRIPPPVTVPLLQVSRELQLPPVLTYSDDVLYNWHFSEPERLPGSFYDDDDDFRLPTPDNILCSTTFTSTSDEEHFYLTSGRIELLGVQALDLMRSTMDEVFVGDLIALRRITGYLQELTGVIGQLKAMLLDVRSGCEPSVFYNQIRPWFRGEDSSSTSGKWVFEGMELDPTLEEPVELSGPSAGQSSLVHALDIFLGVDKYSHDKDVTGHAPEHTHTQAQKSAFLKRMQLYMPRHHRAFLNHLANNPRPLRNLVVDASSPSSAAPSVSPSMPPLPPSPLPSDAVTYSPMPSTPSSSSSMKQVEDDKEKLVLGQSLLEAYNKAVVALKEFRDAHMIIVTLYIINPAREARRMAAAAVETASPIADKPSSLGITPGPLSLTELAELQKDKEVESEYVGRSVPSAEGIAEKDGPSVNVVESKAAAPAPLKGTGGTDLVRFLKNVRDQTKGAVLPSLPTSPSTSSPSMASAT
ncbi:hypothetical protein D9613_012456 [Agrocybe pediades]|uniref:Indoleamine 2,3-dioxygenase n=1 Tax=Agrocybe pediades TaxID=84607 RepID=A0A8H4VM61_9AGAR|nr:hypothetical protein D9613_012456 [Agrocybe pediades]